MKKKTIILVITLLVQLNTIFAQDGSLDSSFDMDGIFTLDINNSNDAINAIITQSDGKIIVVGYTSDSVKNIFCIVRFNIDGSLDNSFGLNGIVTTVFTYTSIASDVALINNGKILVSGYSANKFILARYNNDGSLDTTFGTSGIIETTFTGISVSSRVLKIQADGKILTAGQVTDSLTDSSYYVILRYNQDGSLDNTFGNGGISSGSTTYSIALLTDLVIQQDGKIVVCGISGPSTVIARFNSDGSLDTSFSSNGIKNYNYSLSGNSVFNSLEIQPDGKIIAVGFTNSTTTSNDFLITRHNTDGSFDNTFGNLGIIITSLSSDVDGASDVKLQQDNKILVGGIVYNFDLEFALTRYNTNGDLDLTFGTNGIVQTAIDPNYNTLNSIHIQADGKILAAGSIINNQSDMAIARYNSALLSTFNQADIIKDFSIFPNPISSHAIINFTNEQTNLKIELIDVLGKMINTNMFTGTKFIIEKNDIKPGVYILKLTNQENKTTTKKIIFQ